MSRRRERWARRENLQRQARYRAGLTRWRRVDEELARMVATASGFAGYPAGAEPGEIRLILRPGERLFCRVSRAAVVRPPRWAGRSGRRLAAYSSLDTARLAASGRLPRRRTGRLVEVGPVTVTDQRVVLHGAHRDREWPLDRLAGVEHAIDEPLTVLHLGEGRETCGLAYPGAQAPLLRFMLALARAHRGDGVDPFVARLRADRAAHGRARPGAPQPVTPDDAPGLAAAVLAALGAAYLGRRGQPLRWRIAQFVAAAIATAGVVALVVPHPWA